MIRLDNKKLLLVVFIISLTLILGCKPKSDNTVATEGSNPVKAQKVVDADHAIPVETQKVREGELLREFVYAASVVGIRESKVSPQIPGKVEFTGPEIGDHVTKGQVLVRLNSTSLQAQLNAAKSGYNQALAQLNAMRAKAGRPEDIKMAEENMKAAKTRMEVALTELNRQEQLFAAGAVPQAAVDAAKVNYDGAKAQFQAAKSQYELLNQGARIEQIRVQEAGIKAALANIQVIQSQIQQCTIRAPFSGIVVQKLVQVGEYASPGFAVYYLVSDEGQKIQIGVPVEDFKYVSQAQDIKIETSTGDFIPGRILRSVDAANPDLRTITVEIVPESPTTKLTTGAFAKVHINFALVKQGLIIPRSAVLSEESNPFVYIVQGTTAKKVPVELGAFSNTEYHIKSGLKGNEEVITNGQNYVVDGSTVVVQNDNQHKMTQ